MSVSDGDEHICGRPGLDRAVDTETSLHRALLEAVREITGEPARVRDVSWDHGESGVWVVEGSVRTAVLKAHRQRRKFEQELTAYRDWLPSLRSGLPDGVRTPELLAEHDDHGTALVLSFEAGDPAEDLAMAIDREREVHRLAGGFLAALHDLPHFDADPLSLEDAYRQRLFAWSRRSEGIVPRAVAAWVEERVSEALPALADVSRVRCHRDFTPRNWLVADDGSIVVIDFEHSRPDWRMADLERLWTGPWRRRADLREAFTAGYGSGLTDDDEELLRRFSALAALSTVTWAREHGDAEFERHGWEVLAWLGCAGT